MTATQQPQAPNILIVDDKPANLLLLEKMLVDRGYKPRPVLSGKLNGSLAASQEGNATTIAGQIGCCEPHDKFI